MTYGMSSFAFGEGSLQPLPPWGLVSAALGRENREVRDRIMAKAADEAYMADLWRKYPELVEAERNIFK